MLFKNLLCVQHILFYHASCLQDFQLSFFQTKFVNHCEDHVTFQDTEHQFQEISFVIIFIEVFYSDIPHLYKLFTPL